MASYVRIEHCWKLQKTIARGHRNKDSGSLNGAETVEDAAIEGLRALTAALEREGQLEVISARRRYNYSSDGFAPSTWTGDLAGRLARRGE